MSVPEVDDVEFAAEVALRQSQLSSLLDFVQNVDSSATFPPHPRSSPHHPSHTSAPTRPLFPHTPPAPPPPPSSSSSSSSSLPHTFAASQSPPSPPSLPFNAPPLSPPARSFTAAHTTALARPGSAIRDIPDKQTRNKTIEKAQWYDEMKRLTLRVQALVKERGTHVFAKLRNHPELGHDAQTWEEEARVAMLDQRAESFALASRLKQLRTGLRTFRTFLTTCQAEPQYVERLQAMMDVSEQDLLSCRHDIQSRLDTLARDERLLVKDLDLFARQLDGWTSSAGGPGSGVAGAAGGGGGGGEASAPAHPPAAPGGSSSHKPPAVVLYETFVAERGHTGGWTEDDHAQFLRLKAAFGGQGHFAFVNRVATTINGKTAFDVEEHLAWFSRYCELVEKKRVAVAQWRELKKERQERVAAELAAEEQQAKEEALVARRLRIAERNANKMDVARWKQKRDELRAESDRIAAEAEAVEARAKLEREERRKKLVKAKLEKHARELEQQQQQQQQQQSHEVSAGGGGAGQRAASATSRPPSAQDLLARHAQNLKLAADRRARATALAAEQLERETRLEQLSQAARPKLQATRDANRLTAPTLAYVARVDSTDVPESGRPSCALPRRAQPSWRRGL